MRLLSAILATALLAPSPMRELSILFSQVANEPSPFDTEKLTTIVGCIEERDTKYFLVSKKHPLGIEIRMSADIAGHLGLRAKVKGVRQYTAATKENPGQPNVIDVNNRRSERAWKQHDGWLQVSSLTFMAGDCNKEKALHK